MGLCFQVCMERPKNSMEFFNEWKTLASDSKSKYQTLLRIGGPDLREIFTIEIGYGLLGNFLEVFLNEFIEINAEEILNILEEFTKTGNFGLTLMFLSKEEKLMCLELFGKLKNCFADEALHEKCQILMKKYGVI